MNSKILLVIIALIVAFGAFIFLGNKKTSPTTSTKQPESIESQQKESIVTQPNNPTVTVALTDSGFVPKDITVKPRTRVVWINKNRKAATVDSNDHPTHRLYPFLNLGELSNGSFVQVVFDKAGKYSYHNHYNASETGTVTVE